MLLVTVRCLEGLGVLNEIEHSLELIARWEEGNRQRGANLINAQPRGPELVPTSNINIVTRGGNRIGAYLGVPEQLTIIKLTSPKRSYDSNQ